MTTFINHMRFTVVEWTKTFKLSFITDSFALMTSCLMNSCFLLAKPSQCLCWELSVLNLTVWNSQIYSSDEKHFQILTNNAFSFWNHLFSDMMSLFMSWTWKNQDHWMKQKEDDCMRTWYSENYLWCWGNTFQSSMLFAVNEWEKILTDD